MCTPRPHAASSPWGSRSGAVTPGGIWVRMRIQRSSFCGNESAACLWLSKLRVKVAPRADQVMPDLGLVAVGARHLVEIEARRRVQGAGAERLLPRFLRQLAEHAGPEPLIIEHGVRGRQRSRPGITP